MFFSRTTFWKAGLLMLLGGLLGPSLSGQSLRQTSFTFPEDGIPNNNSQIGDFCCTGRTAPVALSSGEVFGYIYFYNWQGGAYNVGGRTVVNDLQLLLSGAKLNAPKDRDKAKFSFSDDQIRNRRAIKRQIGDLHYTAWVSKAEPCAQRPGFWYADGFEVKVSVRLKRPERPTATPQARSSAPKVQGSSPAVIMRPTRPVGTAILGKGQQASPQVTHLRVRILTGGDDLRGGNDNAWLNLRVNPDLVYGKADWAGPDPMLVEKHPLNEGRRWADHTSQERRIRLPQAIALSDLRSVEIHTSFGGGGGGDNWNINRLEILAEGPNGFSKRVYDRNGNPLVRLTGDRTVFKVRLRP